MTLDDAVLNTIEMDAEAKGMSSDDVLELWNHGLELRAAEEGRVAALQTANNARDEISCLHHGCPFQHCGWCVEKKYMCSYRIIS